MPIIRSVRYNQSEVTAIALDTNSGQYLWIAFKKDSHGNCRILKVSANDLNQIYFDFELAVEAIKTLSVKGSYLIVAVDHASNYLYLYSLANPLVNPTIKTRPSGVNEAPVAFTDDGTDLWWLFPGEADQVAQIVRTTTTGSFQETIPLQNNEQDIHNAKSIVAQDGNLWVVTYEAPVKLIRAYQTDGLWMIQVTSLTS